MIGKSDMPTAMRDKWRARMKKQMSVFGVVKEVRNTEDDVSPLSKLTKDPVDKMQTGSTVLEEEVKAEDVVFCEKPLAIVLNDELAEGKICPIQMSLMTAPLPCTLGSTALFSTEETRKQANETYHRYEYKCVEPMKTAGLAPKAKLALRIVTTLGPNNVKPVLEKKPETEAATRVAKLLDLPLNTTTADEDFEIALLTSYLVSCLETTDFVAKNGSPTKQDVTELVDQIIRAVLTHTRSIYYSQGSVNKSDLWTLSKMPVKEFAIGVFPEFSTKLKNSKNCDIANVLSFFHRGTIFLQSIRTVPAGQEINVRLNAAEASAVAFPANMITHKCSGCPLSFPLHKTHEQPIKCPLEECGVETNIWKRLKRIQELKRDHEEARRDIEYNEDGKLGIQMLKTIISELETMVCRPDKFLNTLDEDLAKTLVLKHMESEQAWLKENK